MVNVVLEGRELLAWEGNIALVFVVALTVNFVFFFFWAVPWREGRKESYYCSGAFRSRLAPVFSAFREEKWEPAEANMDRSFLGGEEGELCR